MGKATQRRERREAERLKGLAAEEPEQFVREWHRKLQGWTREVVARGFAAASATTPKELRLPIFGVLEKAQRLLALSGEDAQRLVGRETRIVLENECCQVFARLAGAYLYRLSNSDSNYLLMRAGTHRPHR